MMGEGEAAKTLATVEDLCRGFAQWGLTRGDVVVAVGGGVVTDTAGFAAAVYHRGHEERHANRHPGETSPSPRLSIPAHRHPPSVTDVG